jgi:hypothetical protein
LEGNNLITILVDPNGQLKRGRLNIPRFIKRFGGNSFQALQLLEDLKRIEEKMSKQPVRESSEPPPDPYEYDDFLD